MARLPTLRRYKPEDYPSAPEWFRRFLGSLSEFTEIVYSALNRQLSISENFAASVKDLSFRTAATYSSGDFEALRFEHGLRQKALGVLLLQALEDADGAPPIPGPVSLDWVEQNGSIVIRRVQGLENSKRYRVRVVAVV